MENRASSIPLRFLAFLFRMLVLVLISPIILAIWLHFRWLLWQNGRLKKRLMESETAYGQKTHRRSEP